MDRRDQYRLVAGSVVAVLVCLGITTTVLAAADAAPTRCASIDSAYAFLYDMMDRYHETFDVYTDWIAGGNHYVPECWMDGDSGLTFDGDWSGEPQETVGCSCIRVDWDGLSSWEAIAWVEATDPDNSCEPSTCLGYDLTGATKLRFRARADEPGVQLEFGVGHGLVPPLGVRELKTLETSWQDYEIDLSVLDLSDMRWGFVFVTHSWGDPTPPGYTFYLDDIQYDLARPDSLRFILSYLTDCSPGDSTWAINQAYTYDNALAMLAFLARGTDEDLRRARIIGDAFVFAQEYDRHYTNGRLRNAYSSGDLRDRRTGKARLPGWWGWGVNDEGDTTWMWMEDAYQTGALTGEMAWVTLAWLTHDQLTGDGRYIDHATSLAQWIDDSCYDSSGIAGYAGGYIDSMPDPPREEWRATEHNIDVYVAFTRLAQIAEDDSWHDRARSALDFVEAMWDEPSGHLWAGTVDSSTINEFSPLDPQTFSLLGSLALDPYSSAISWAEQNCAVECMGYNGFHFSTVCDGIWWEGTAQMCCALLADMRYAEAAAYLNELRAWQSAAPGGDGRGIVAACPDSIWTGIWKDWGLWHYYDRLHVGATAWYLFAELDFNPFWGGPTGVEGGPAPPHAGNALFALGRPRPSPAASETRVGYDVFVPCHITLTICNVAGREIARLVDEVRPPGSHVAVWDGRDGRGRSVPSGVYFCRLTSAAGSQTCKTVIVR